MADTFKLKIPLAYRRFLMIQHFFGNGLVLLDGFGDALCLLSKRAWSRTLEQIGDRWINENMSEGWIKSRLVNFYKERIETTIDLWVGA